MDIVETGSGRWLIKQKKEWAEILVDYESKNSYEICSDQGMVMGYAMERDSGFLGTLARMVLRSHRSFDLEVLKRDQQPQFSVKRPFFFLFSSMEVTLPTGRPLGAVHRRFGILYKKYDLQDARGKIFATIKSPLWKLWRFPIFDATGNREVGEISKKWGGGLKEIFSDADTFMVDIRQANFSPDQQQIVIAAAFAIDFDFFEDNSGGFNLLSLGD